MTGWLTILVLPILAILAGLFREEVRGLLWGLWNNCFFMQPTSFSDCRFRIGSHCEETRMEKGNLLTDWFYRKGAKSAKYIFMPFMV
jgi:hypothetical protein